VNLKLKKIHKISINVRKSLGIFFAPTSWGFRVPSGTSRGGTILQISLETEKRVSKPKGIRRETSKNNND
jgi:hypothetical protein